MTATPSQDRAPTPIELAMTVREGANNLWRRLNQHHVGTPETGAVHRGVTLDLRSRSSIKADIVEPRGEGPHPVLIYLHGGGWVAGSLDDYTQLVGRFAEQGFVVVAVDYALAPEQPFPAGYDDVVASVRWVVENIERYGGDPNRIALAGDSAGANLAAAVGVCEPDLPVRAVGLLYGTFDLETMGVDPAFRTLLLQAYIGEGADLALGRDPRISPIHAAEKMPPAFILLGSGDNPSVIAHGIELADRMRAAGIPHEHVVIDDYEHGFMQMETLPETLPTFKSLSAFLKKHMPG